MPAASPAHEVLQEVLGYPAFRGPQAEIVEHVTAGGDALVLMPTGGGKRSSSSQAKQIVPSSRSFVETIRP